jgi:hypothetical protein
MLCGLDVSSFRLICEDRQHPKPLRCRRPPWPELKEMTALGTREKRWFSPSTRNLAHCQSCGTFAKRENQILLSSKPFLNLATRLQTRRTDMDSIFAPCFRCSFQGPNYSGNGENLARTEQTKSVLLQEVVQTVSQAYASTAQ